MYAQASEMGGPTCCLLLRQSVGKNTEEYKVSGTTERSLWGISISIRKQQSSENYVNFALERATPEFIAMGLCIYLLCLSF